MPASLVPNAKQQFEDINGNPLVGGLVYFYTINTLTPKDTWQDSEQNVLNTNPVVLDSRGQAIIYGVGAYRQILTDADGNLIWDQPVSDYQTSVFGPQDTLAANTVTDLGSVASNNILITGTTTINSFGTSAVASNPVYLLQFQSPLTITYNATSMILPGGANLTTAANSSALVEVIDPAMGYWRMIAYFSPSVSGSLGTAASQNIGTSGANVPLLSGNNTWSGSNVFNKQTYGPEVALAISAGAATPDFATGNNFSISTANSFTLNNPVNAPTSGGQSGIIRVNQTASGKTVSFGSAYKASGGISGVNLSGINNANDYFAYYAHSSSEIIITPLLNPT